MQDLFAHVETANIPLLAFREELGGGEALEENACKVQQFHYRLLGLYLLPPTNGCSCSGYCLQNPFRFICLSASVDATAENLIIPPAGCTLSAAISFLRDKKQARFSFQFPTR